MANRQNSDAFLSHYWQKKPSKTFCQKFWLSLWSSQFWHQPQPFRWPPLILIPRKNTITILAYHQNSDISILVETLLEAIVILTFCVRIPTASKRVSTRMLCIRRHSSIGISPFWCRNSDDRPIVQKKFFYRKRLTLVSLFYLSSLSLSTISLLSPLSRSLSPSLSSSLPLYFSFSTLSRSLSLPLTLSLSLTSIGLTFHSSIITHFVKLQDISQSTWLLGLICLSVGVRVRWDLHD